MIGGAVGAGVGAIKQQIGSRVRNMSVGAGVGVGAIRQQIGSIVRSSRNVGSGVGVASKRTSSDGAGVKRNAVVSFVPSVGAGVGVGDATNFSVSVELVNTRRLEFGAGVALGSSFVA